MDLSVRDRLMLLEILPTEGDITTIRIVRELREMLSFTEKEHANFGITMTQNQDGTMGITWNESTETLTTFDFGIKSIGIIQKALEILNDKGKLTESHVELYDKFVTNMK